MRQVNEILSGQRINHVTANGSGMVLHTRDNWEIYLGWTASGPYLEKAVQTIPIPLDIDVDTVTAVVQA